MKVPMGERTQGMYHVIIAVIIARGIAITYRLYPRTNRHQKCPFSCTSSVKLDWQQYCLLITDGTQYNIQYHIFYSQSNISANSELIVMQFLPNLLFPISFKIILFLLSR